MSLLQSRIYWTVGIDILILAVYHFPVVRSEHVRTLFDSTQSQESESELRSSLSQLSQIELFQSLLSQELSCYYSRPYSVLATLAATWFNQEYFLKNV